MMAMLRLLIAIIFGAVVGSALEADNSIKKDEITVIVAVDEGNKVGRKAVGKALALDEHPNLRVKVTEVILKDETTEEQVCDKIFRKGAPPALLIDATVKPQVAGSRTSPMIKSFARKMGLPTISTSYSLGNEVGVWRGLSTEEKERLIHVNPPGDTIPTMIKDLTVHYSLRTAAVFYDKTFEMDHKYVTLFEDTNTRYILREAPVDIEGMLKEVIEAQMLNYFVLGSVETINSFLEAAQKLKMFGMEYGWYMITKDRGKLKCKTCHLGSVMFIQPVKSNKAEYNHTSTLTGLTLENKVDAYFYYDLTRFVVSTISDLMRRSKWPSLSYPKCGASLSNEQLAERKALILGREMSMEGFYGQFGRFFLDFYDNGLNYQSIVMRMNKVELWIDQPYRNVKAGDWEFGQPSGRLMFPQYLEMMKPGGIRKKIKVVTIIQPPFVMKTSSNASAAELDRFGKPVHFYGYCIDLLNLIKDKMTNCTPPEYWEFEIYEVPDGQFGTKDKTKAEKKWNGVIGELAYPNVGGDTHIGLGPISVMAERETVVDFTVPYYDLVGISILMKKPAVPSHLFKFLTVLENDVWLTILGAYILTSVLLFVYDRLSPYSYYNNKEGWRPDEERRDFTFKECLWFCMTSLTPQGGGEAPLNLSGRLAAGTWWMFGFIVIASYTANLAAFLTVSRLESPIESLDHLSNQFRIRYAPQVGTQAKVYFERMSYIEEQFYKIWKKMSLDDGSAADRAKYAVWDYPVSDKYTKMLAQMHAAGMPKSYEEGVRRAKASRSAQEGFAFVAEATMVKYATMTNCELQSVGNEFSRKPLALVVRQNSSLKDQLSSAILKLLNERMLESLKEEWWSKNKEKKHCDTSRKSSDGISIHNIGGVFIVIFIGVVFACITLAFEYCFLKRKKTGAVSQAQANNYNNIFRGPGVPPPAFGAM